MATIARSRRLRDVRVPLEGGRAVAVGLVLLTAYSLYLRTRTFGTPFWIDEGLSVGIGSYPLLDIPGVLRQDGSPPLYYMLIHVWMDVFGDGEAATQALSLVFALATIPLAFWLARMLFDERAAWFCAVLAALNPYITSHAQETRMYSLAVLLSLLASGATLKVFAERDRRWIPALALFVALGLYTHNWTVFLVAGICAAIAYLVWRADGEERRALVRDAALALGGALLLFAPWLPTLAYQAAHTGAPWANPPAFGAIRREVAATLGGAGPSVALLLAGGGVLWALFRGPASRERRLFGALTLLLAVALLSAWLASQVEPAWANRYFAVMVGPLLLLAGAAVSRAGTLGMAALVITALFWGQPHGWSEGSLSPERDVMAGVADTGLLREGDLVISTHPERATVLWYYLPEDLRDELRWATPLGEVDDPRAMDWRDALERLETARTRRTIEPLLATVPPGGHVLLVRPIIRSDTGWDAPWTELVRRRSAQWSRYLRGDERFVRIAKEPDSYADKLRGVRALVYEKESCAPGRAGCFARKADR